MWLARVCGSLCLKITLIMAILSNCPCDLNFPESFSQPPPPLSSILDFGPRSWVQTKSFAQALNNSCAVPLSQLPKPCLKGYEISKRIPENEYLAGLAGCKTYLHGRLLLSKYSAPLKTADLSSKLLVLWNKLGPWHITSSGKGFFEFSFSSLEDLRRVLAVGLWNLDSRSLRVFSWTKDFNPSSLKQSTAQVWVRFFGFLQEYWRPMILFAIAGGLEARICLDEATDKETFDHFARVLIDLDLNSKLGNQILVERDGYAFGRS